MIRNFKHVLLKKLLLAVLLSIVSFNALTESDKSPDPIHILVNDWTSQHILATITGEIFSSMGYQIKYSVSDIHEQWGALSLGIDHVQIEVWQGSMAEMFERVVKSKKVIDAGTHDAITREDWWYPLYVEKLCPGLPHWTALKKCAEVFATKPGSKVGHYLAGPWEKPELARIRALGLNFQIDATTKAAELWLKLNEAEKLGKPIIMFNWTPNWVETVYPGRFVEFPAYHPECETNPEWGVNKQFHYDCGNPKKGWLKKAAWAGMPQKWPCAFKTLLNINFDNRGISAIASWHDHDKIPIQQAAKRWLKENQSRWRNWIPTSCKKP